MQLDDVTLALEDALAHVVAAERKQWTREREHIEIEARAAISDLRAEVAHLKTANEMLRIDLAKRVDEEVLRVREAVALVKDGAAGPQGEPGVAGKDAELDFDYINRTIADLVELRAAEWRGEQGPQGEPGKDGAPGVKGDAGEKGDQGERGIDGRGIVDLTIDEESGDLWARYTDDTAARIGSARGLPGAKGEAGEKGEKGDTGPQGERGETGSQGRGIEYVELIDGLLAIKWSDDENMQGLGMVRGPAGEPGPPGESGQSVTVEEVAELVLRQLPPPEKGEQGLPGEKGPPGADADYDIIARMVDDSIKGMPKPKDGVGLAGALIDRSGSLVLTLTDGTVRELGAVVGRDGAPGRDGKDGLGFDDFALEPEYDGERTLRLRWFDAKGNEQVREWRMPIMLYREVHKTDARYEAGDTVRYGGSLWLAVADTSEKPGDGCKDWRLVARAGRDGRGEKGEKGEKGDPGRPGRDLTFLTGGS